MFLIGPCRQLKNMCAKERALATTIMLVRWEYLCDFMLWSSSTLVKMELQIGDMIAVNLVITYLSVCRYVWGWRCVQLFGWEIYLIVWQAWHILVPILLLSFIREPPTVNVMPQVPEFNSFGNCQNIFSFCIANTQISRSSFTNYLFFLCEMAN